MQTAADHAPAFWLGRSRALRPRGSVPLAIWTDFGDPADQLVVVKVKGCDFGSEWAVRGRYLDLFIALSNLQPKSW